jgi:hypothetical protein
MTLRKMLPDVLGNELGCDYAIILAILNHTDHSSTGHYYFKSFNSLVKPIQHYADWLWGLRHGGTTIPHTTCRGPDDVGTAADRLQITQR